MTAENSHIGKSDTNTLKQYLPFITEPDLLKSLADNAFIKKFSAGETIISAGDYIKMVPLVLQGAIKVIRIDAKGSELFLYYIEPGETCAVSLTCCSSLQKSEIKAVAEEETIVLSIPFTLHDELMEKHRQWKQFVAMTYQKRFQNLLETVDEIAFKNMDERLLNYIIVKTKQLKTNELNMTHQEIANEMGTSREVVSRLLKQLEKRKWIELGRNKIYVKDGLEEIIQSS